MPSALLGTAAGASDPIRALLERIQQDQLMAQRDRQLEETTRSNKADEATRARQVDETAGLRRSSDEFNRNEKLKADKLAGERQVLSRVALRSAGDVVSPQEREQERGTVPDSLYKWAPPNLGATAAGPGRDNPDAGPAGEIPPSGESITWQGTGAQNLQQQRIDKTGQGVDPFESTDKGLIPRSVLRGMFDKGTTLARPVQPDRTVVPTDQGYIPRPKVAAAAAAGTPMQPQATAATRTMSEGAKAIQPHVQDIKAQAADLEKAGLFGPLLSRIRHAAEKAGTIDEFQAMVGQDTSADDYRVGKFASSLALLASGTARVHYGGRAGSNKEAYNRFKEMLGDASTLEMFNGRVDAVDDYMQGYAGMTGGKGGDQGGVPKVGGTFNGGRVLKVTPIK